MIWRYLRKINEKQRQVWLLLSDLVIWLGALYLTLVVVNWSAPELAELLEYGAAFLPILAFWLIVFFVFGLYDRRTLILRHKVPALVIYSQVTNFILAVLFFYFAPHIELAPQGMLLLYMVLATALTYIWRVKVRDWWVGIQARQNALLIGSGPELQELKEEVNSDSTYGFQFVSSLNLDRLETIDIQSDLLNTAYSEGVQIIGIDLRHDQVDQILPYLYNLMFYKVRFVDFQRMYEEVFERVPLSAFHYNWFLENISTALQTPYDVLKRAWDIGWALFFGVLTIWLWPVVYIFSRIDRQSSLLSRQVCVGKNSQEIRLLSFTVKSDEGRDSRFVRWLRGSGLDRLPRLYNLLRGDLSLVGPQPVELDVNEACRRKVPYYTVRHLIRPGLWSWGPAAAETHQDPDSVNQVLAYDLYYLKNRSFVLDIRTIFAILKRWGWRLFRRRS